MTDEYHEWISGKFKTWEEIPELGSKEAVVSLCLKCRTYRWGPVTGGVCK